MRRQLVLNDVHLPHQDGRTLGMLSDFIEMWKPQDVILAGDIMNAACLSTKFRELTKDARADRLLTERNTTVDFLQRLRDWLPGATIRYLDGNHENRYAKYVATKCPELIGLPGMSLPDVLGLKKLRIDHRPYGAMLPLGKLNVTHGEIVRKGSGASARAMLAKYGVSVLFGHTHRGGAVYLTDAKHTIAAWENYCLCRMQQPYTIGPNDWQQGWSIVHNDMARRFHVTQVPVVQHEFLFDGRTYGPKAKNRIFGGLRSLPD